jgi:transcriptional regulator with XRE-family HTH domain
MATWRKAHHRRGDPYYERLLQRSREAGKERTRDAQVDREWRGRRVRHTIAELNAAGVTCQQIMSALGVSEMTVYDWRSGKRLPTPRNAERLYRLLDEFEAVA